MVRPHMFLFISLGMLLVLGIGACAPAPTPTARVKPTVIATTTQIQDVLENILDDRMTVVGLVPRNGDPHEFEPTPEDVRKVASSQAVFKNGGLETWLDKLIENAGGQRPIFDVTQGMKLATIDRAFEEGGETDPHVWMNPVLMLSVVDNVTGGVKQLDPPGATVYDANAEAYKSKLRELDAWTEQQVSTIPPQHRKLVTAHDALGYFADRYGFEIVGYLTPTAGTEVGGSSAKQLADLEDKIRTTGVKTVFAEVSINPKFIQQVAADTHVKVDELYVDSLGERGSEAGTYIDFFRTDVNRIVNGLK
jgi:manganese/iron transport system substrate-binding protein